MMPFGFTADRDSVVEASESAERQGLAVDADMRHPLARGLILADANATRLGPFTGATVVSILTVCSGP